MRAVDIPDWFVWIALGLFVLQALGLVPVVRRMREADPTVRSKARLDLLDTVGALLMVSSLMLSLVVAESWVWLGLTGFAVIVAVYAVKGVRLLRTRRHRPTA
ncbi:MULTISPECIES: hypothetical protein [unclassified Streptomyces]|uniref:hypothetical protein n=1 Tax=unclassified Streptomyces TaxID=2593676 RepID=UPI002965E9AD|nr:hypothetical protein [Streptomyces sp. SJL17-1]